MKAKTKKKGGKKKGKNKKGGKKKGQNFQQVLIDNQRKK